MTSSSLTQLAAFNLQEISQNWGHSSLPMDAVLLSVGGVVLLLGALASIRFYRTRQQHTLPRWIFLRVARQLGLSLADQVLLYRIARHESLPTPLTLLLSTRTLHHHTRGFLREASRGHRQRVLVRIWHIRRRLVRKRSPAALGKLPL